MSSNSRQRRINYTPRFTQMEAYDRLPKPIRDALKEGVQEWDTGHFLRLFAKMKRQGHPINKIIAGLIDNIEFWNENEIKRADPWQPEHKKGARKLNHIPSPHQRANATMMMSDEREIQRAGRAGR